MVVVIAQDSSRVLVTGAASGLGRATVGLLRAGGATVAGVDVHTPDPAGDGTDPDVVLPADVTDAAAVRAAVDEAAAALGGLDGLVLCAGVFHNRLIPTHLLGDEQWDRTLAVNLTGAFSTLRAALPHLVSGGGGAIVVVASTAARVPQPGGAAYAASKAGVAALARTVALEYAVHGIRCNAVLPGYLATPMTAKALSIPDLRAGIERAIPQHRIADPAEVAAVIRFLLSGAASYTTGEEVVVDGGSALTAYTADDDVDRMWRRVERHAR
jgi:NAD(P)-dependent dehydrogenase (short-subunit alcohol dehydrogenase family)